MYCQSPKSLRKANTVFDRFCRDVHILPPDTPVFLIDGIGRVVCSKRLNIKSSDFASIYSLIDEEFTEYFRNCMKSADAFALQAGEGQGKDHIVISKDDYGFSRCVVCSSGEKGSLGLHDFVARLCSYRDYLESFENLAVSSTPRMPVKWIFGLKISGALELMDLARADREPERSITFPLMMGLEKLCGFIGKVNGNKTELVRDGDEGGIYVTAPEAFFKLVVSAAALAERFSRTGVVRLSALRIDERNAARINIFTDGRACEGDIFEKALISALEAFGFNCGILDADGVYGLWFEVSLATPEGITVSDVKAVSSWIDSLLENQDISALHFTISDK